MADYIEITDTEVEPEAPIISSLGFRWRDNAIAMFEKASGAPVLANDYVVQDMISAGSVGQGELKSTTASQSTVGPGDITVSLTGGSYTMGWFVGTDGNTNDPDTGGVVAPLHGGTYSATVGAAASGTYTLYVYSRYFQASPPYNLGYGEIPRFNLVMLDKTTLEVLGTYSAEDPPWAYHGPHNLHPVDGIAQKAAGLWGVDINALLAQNRAATIAKLKQAKQIKANPGLLKKAQKDHAFSIEEKNIDMDVVPHLFSNYDPTKHVVVMLDPCCSCAEELALCEEFTGEEYSISNLLHDGYVKISNDELDVRTPKGVKTIKFRMK